MARLCKVRVEIFLSLLCDGEGITVVVGSLGSLFLRIRMDNFQCELQDDFATGERLLRDSEFRELEGREITELSQYSGDGFRILWL